LATPISDAFNIDTQDAIDAQDAVLAVFAELTISDALNSRGGYDVTGIGGTVVGPHGGGGERSTTPRRNLLRSRLRSVSDLQKTRSTYGCVACKFPICVP
jgi:hypothetical protein